MAINFKKNMFWCWRDETLTKGIVGFTSKDWRLRQVFIDKLFTNLCNTKNLFIQDMVANRYALIGTIEDDLKGLFANKDRELVTSFFNKKIPNFFTVIFRRKYYKEWEHEFSAIKKLTKLEIEITHDFVGFLIYSISLQPEEVSAEIRKVALDSDLEIHENNQLENINILANRTFD